MYDSEHKFDVRKCNTMRLGESHRLVTTVLVQNKIQNLFLTTIVATAIFLSPRRGNGALAFFFYRRGTTVANFQLRGTSLTEKLIFIFFYSIYSWFSACRANTTASNAANEKEEIKNS